MSPHRIARHTLVLTLLATSAAQAQKAEWQTPSKLPPSLAHVRAALDKYQDPVVAVRDGYFSTLGCIDYPTGGDHGAMQYKAGGMGVHFLNMGLVGPGLDSLKPQVLIYIPEGDKLRLAAAEWFVPLQAAGGNRPSIFGKELEGPMEGHEPLMPPELHHYDLHVWLWRDNPNGVFSPTNPSVKCPANAYSFAEKAPKIVPVHQKH